MQTRSRLLQRFGLAAAASGLLALLFLLGGHWVIGSILAVVAAVCVWLFLQARAVR